MKRTLLFAGVALASLSVLVATFPATLTQPSLLWDKYPTWVSSLSKSDLGALPLTSEMLNAGTPGGYSGASWCWGVPYAPPEIRYDVGKMICLPTTR